MRYATAREPRRLLSSPSHGEAEIRLLSTTNKAPRVSCRRNWPARLRMRRILLPGCTTRIRARARRLHALLHLRKPEKAGFFSSHYNVSASPLREGGRIEVRGCSSVQLPCPTLTPP